VWLRGEGSRHPVGERRRKGDTQVPEAPVVLGIEDAVPGCRVLLLHSRVQLRGDGAGEVLQGGLGG
jgi:hypothetical protein